jgi:hypothetical protein
MYIKARKSGDIWYITIPKESREKALTAVQAQKAKRRRGGKPKGTDIFEISTDWVLITVTEDISAQTAPPSFGVARIKVGSYEIEAGSGFPVEKLALMLRSLGGEPQ